MKTYPPYNKLRLRRQHLPSHGQGPLYSWSLRRGSWGNGVRISIGGYGWRRKWYQPHWTRYPYTATHFGVGPITVSLVGCTSLYCRWTLSRSIHCKSQIH